MRSISISDEFGAVGAVVDVEETIEEAVTWAENNDLTVTYCDKETVYVEQRVDGCDGGDHTTFIVLTTVQYDQSGDVDGVYQFCANCLKQQEADETMRQEEIDAHNEHWETMMREMEG